jgi:hypothetical protein
MNIHVGSVEIEIIESFNRCIGKPIGVTDEIEGSRMLAYMMTPDGGNVHAGYTIWTDGTSDLCGIVKVSGPEVYNRATTAGRMPVSKREGTSRSVRLRALRYAGKDRANLANVSWDQLNGLIHSSAQEELTKFGAIELGTAETILGVHNKTKNQLAMIFDEQDLRSVFAAFALTRIIPLMENFGMEQLDSID